jgi:hypothetical protein
MALRAALLRRRSTAGAMLQHASRRASGDRSDQPSRRCVGCWRMPKLANIKSAVATV